MIIPLLWSSGNLLEDCCLTFTTAEPSLNMRCALSLLTHRFTKRGEPGVLACEVTLTLGPAFPKRWQTNPTRFVLCCSRWWFSLFPRWCGFGFFFSSDVTKHFDHSQIIFELGENLLTVSNHRNSAGLGANTSWSQLAAGFRNPTVI